MQKTRKSSMSLFLFLADENTFIIVFLVFAAAPIWSISQTPMYGDNPFAYICFLGKLKTQVSEFFLK